MASIALGVAGAAIGSSFGQPALGWAIGTTLGGVLFGPKMPDVERGRLSDLRIQGASFGTAIPLVYGSGRIAGTVIWTSGIREHVSTSHSGGKGGGGTTTKDYTYDVDLAILLCAGPIVRVNKIWADAELIYNYNGGTQQGYTLTSGTHVWTSSTLRVYKGTTGQGQDSLMQAAVDAQYGSGSTPAYRDRAYVVFERFDLGKYGNRLPNFTFEVVQASTPSLETVLTSLLGLVGVDSGDIDATAVSGTTVRGLVVPQRAEVRQTIEALQSAYQFDLVEYDGQIVARPRSGLSATTILSADVGARAGEGQTRVSLTRVQEPELPRQVDVTYFDTANDYQQGTQTAIRQSGSSKELKTIALPLSLTADEARAIAETELYRAWVGRTGAVTSLPWRHLYLTPGDVIELPDVAGADRQFRIESITAGLPGAIEIQAVSYDSAIYSQAVPGAAPPDLPTQSVGIVSTAWKAFSCPQLRDSDGTKPGFYVAATGASGWQGATIYYSPDGGTTYLVGGSVAGRSVIGTTSSVLADGTTAETWDYTNDVDITLDAAFDAATLENATATEVLYGDNVAVIGGELVGFQTATLTGTLAYTLNDLYRGMRASDMTGHASPETFVLTSANIVYVELPDTAVGETYRIKCVSPGEDIGDVAYTTVVICEPDRPYIEMPDTDPLDGQVPVWRDAEGKTVWEDVDTVVGTRWVPLSNGDPTAPELIFSASGEVIVVLEDV